MRGNGSFDRFNHIPPTRVGNELIRRARTHFKKPGHSLGCKNRDSAVELVFQAAPCIDEPDFFAVLGLVDGAEILKTELATLVFASPDRSRSPVTEQAETDENSRLVIQEKSGRGNFYGYCGHGRLRIRSKKAPRGFQKWQRRAAA